MHKVVLALIATSVSICIKADDKLHFEIYEIRKTAPNLKALDLDNEATNVRIGDQYFDNDGVDGPTSKFNVPENNNREVVETVANSLIKKLRSIANFKQYYPNMDADHDYIYSYSALRDDSIFRNNGGPPVFLVANKNILYHINPHSTRNIQNKVQSILRTINNDNDVEDRTAPPFKKIRYDYEYD